MKFFKFLAIAAVTTLALQSCSKDTEIIEQGSLKAEGLATAPQGIIPGTTPANGKWVVSDIKNWFDGYYRTFDGSSSLPPNYLLVNNNATPNRYAVGGRAFNGSYYTLNQTSGFGVRGILKSNSNLSQEGFISVGGTALGQKAEVNFTLFDATTGYFTDVDLSPGVIKVFNPQTMIVTKSKNLSNKVGVKLPAYESATLKHIGGKMLIRRGNYLYADVTFGAKYNNLKQVEQSDNHIYVAVINANTFDVESILKSTVNAENIGLFNDHPLVNIDPVTKDIYFATVGDMIEKSDPNSSRIFKIDANNNLISVAGYQAVNGNKRGEFNRMYAYNGDIYTTIAIDNTSYLSNGHGEDYRKNIWKWSVIKKGSTTATAITGIPVNDNFFAYQQPTLINGEIYVIVNSKNFIGQYDGGIYKITPGTTSATQVSLAKAGGLGWGVAYSNKISSVNKL